MVARDVDLKPIAISFGDFNPWAGDWSEVVGNTDHERRFAAPTSAYWVTDTSVDPQMTNALKALMETYAMQISYMDKIKSGVLYLQTTDPGNQVTLQRIFDVNENVAWTKVIDTSDGNLDLTLTTGNWLAFPFLMDMMEATLNGLHHMESYQGDRAKVKVSASPYGGDTHAQHALTHAKMQVLSSATKESAMPMHNYTEIASLPIYGSSDVISVAGGLNVADNVYAWDIPTWSPDNESTNADDKDIAAPDAALDDIAGNLGSSTLTFPLFVNKSDDATNHGTLSFYQPHLLPGGDGYSAKILVAAGGYASPNGFISSGTQSDLSVTSAGMPLALPDISAKHTCWIDGTRIGHVGSYGIDDGDRPWHTELVNVNTSISAHYRTNKLAGDGAFTFGLFGYGYNAVPLTPADWPVISVHINPQLKHALGQTYSLYHSVFNSGTDIGIEVANLAQPYMMFQWSDMRGAGVTATGTELTGSRYKYSSRDMSTAKAAYMDSRKADAGSMPSPIFHLPFLQDKFKLWISEVDVYGVQTTAGRFSAMSANDAGLTETTGGALFTQRPDLVKNLYCNWTAEDPKQVIGRFTVKVI